MNSTWWDLREARELSFPFTFVLGMANYAHCITCGTCALDANVSADCGYIGFPSILI